MHTHELHAHQVKVSTDAYHREARQAARIRIVRATPIAWMRAARMRVTMAFQARLTATRAHLRPAPVV